MAIKVEILTRESIKPSLPTPPHLKSYPFSRFDQNLPLCYTPSVLFYTDENNKIEISKHLKESLSKALPKFYPFAGRLNKDNYLSIDCNDEGVDFLEAQVNCRIEQLFEQPNLEIISNLVPIESTEMTTDPMLLVQVSTFIGGGFALGINICHKIADSATLCTIIKAWADTAIGKPDVVVPDLTVADLYPATVADDLSPPRGITLLPTPRIYNDHEMLRVVFEASKLESLKTSCVVVESPTRVEVVLALLWKCAIKASLEKSPHMLLGVANTRATLVPPLPAYACGNIFEPLAVLVSDEREIDVSYIASGLRKTKEEAKRRCLASSNGGGGSSPRNGSAPTHEINMLLFTSGCRMPFYEPNIGWGKPIWACYGVLRFYGFYLMDSQEGDGIEAWIKLNEHEMDLFRKDEELMAFGSINPSVRLS